MKSCFRNTLEKDDGEKFTILYYLTDSEDEASVKEYGMGIRIEDTGEEERIDRISPSKAKVEELIELCFKNEVTPTTLFDIVYDYICA